MNKNNVHATRIASSETVSGHEQDGASNHHNDEQQEAKKRLSVMDIWSIRRGARVYRIHNRIPRI